MTTDTTFSGARAYKLIYCGLGLLAFWSETNSMIHDRALHLLCFLLLLILNNMDVIIYGVQKSTKHLCVIIISLSNHCTSGGSGGCFDKQSTDLSDLLVPAYLSISLRLFPIRQS